MLRAVQKKTYIIITASGKKKIKIKRKHEKIMDKFSFGGTNYPNHRAEM